MRERTARLPRVSPGFGLSAAATSDTTGYAFQADVFKHQIWITRDAGRRWRPVTVR
jgi:hypothetical protein